MNFVAPNISLNSHRPTYALSESDCSRIFSAVVNSNVKGMMISRFVTISWFKYGLTDLEGYNATQRFFKLLSDYCRSISTEFSYVWVRENDADGNENTSHVHFLMHAGPAAFPQLTRHFFRKWLKTVIGQKYIKSTIKTERVKGSRGFSARSGKIIKEPQKYKECLYTILQYILKGADQTAARRLELKCKLKGGKVTGKRFGISRNIETKIDNAISLGRFLTENKQILEI